MENVWDLVEKAYIYDYSIDAAAHKVEIRVTGRRMSPEMRETLYQSAASHGIPRDALTITENTLQETDDIIRSEQLASKVEQSEIEDARRDAMILSLSEQLDSLRARLDSLESLQEPGTLELVEF